MLEYDYWLNAGVHLGPSCIVCRNLTKFEFNNVEVRTFSIDSKFDECVKRRVVECEFVENPCFTTDFVRYAQTAREQRDFFLKFSLSHKLQLLNVQRNFLFRDVLHCSNMNSDFIDFRK